MCASHRWRGSPVGRHLYCTCVCTISSHGWQWSVWKALWRRGLQPGRHLANHLASLQEDYLRMLSCRQAPKEDINVPCSVVRYSIHRRGRTGFEETKDFPIRMHDLIAGRYQVVDFLGSAAFSRAVQALDIKTGMLVCLKIIKVRNLVLWHAACLPWQRYQCAQCHFAPLCTV